MKNTILIFATIALAVLFGCDQPKLSNDEARLLIIKTLNLPITYRHDIDKRPSMGSGFELDGLRNAGLITGSEYLESGRLIEIQITKMGQSSFIGENNDAYMFKTNDIDFYQITGISINKEEQTATVRFSIIAKNATLAAYALAKTKAGFSGRNYINYSLINPLNGELVFKKFDNGWQLLEQGKSSSDLLNQILNSDSNSNEQDDYSNLISNTLNEIELKDADEKFQKEAKNSEGKIEDIDGNVYNTVRIGTQVWMVGNLRTTKFNDGTSIPNVTDNIEWYNLKTPGYVFYNGDPSYKNSYGALYNWYAVNTGRLCPKGWHVPTDAEWTTLITFLGGESVAGGKLKETGISNWRSSSTDIESLNVGATNETNFTALPGGQTFQSDFRPFRDIGYGGSWWSSSESKENAAWARVMLMSSSEVARVENEKVEGISVRCIKD